MPVIYVKATSGRVARMSPTGRFIPQDKYVRVEHTPYVDRLLNVHGDIERRPEPVKKITPAPTPPATPDVGVKK